VQRADALVERLNPVLTVPHESIGIARQDEVLVLLVVTEDQHRTTIADSLRAQGLTQRASDSTSAVLRFTEVVGGSRVQVGVLTVRQLLQMLHFRRRSLQKLL
jgi:hypothetical protein